MYSWRTTYSSTGAGPFPFLWPHGSRTHLASFLCSLMPITRFISDLGMCGSEPPPSLF